jgi:hypothetical protein
LGIVAGVWEPVFGTGCEEETKEGKGPCAIEEVLSRERGEEGSSREDRGLGGVGFGGEGKPKRREFLGRIWIKS